VYYCGENQYGQFGDATPTTVEADKPRVVIPASQGGPFVQIAAGESHMVALRGDGIVYVPWAGCLQFVSPRRGSRMAFT
jgi:alpha-tubulin suppressor-like RCC1 family protein